MDTPIVAMVLRPQFIRTIADAMGHALRAGNPYAEGHARRVGECCRAITGDLGLSDDETETAMRGKAFSALRMPILPARGWGFRKSFAS